MAASSNISSRAGVERQRSISGGAPGSGSVGVNINNGGSNALDGGTRNSSGAGMNTGGVGGDPGGNNPTTGVPGGPSPVPASTNQHPIVKIGHYVLGETLGVGTFGKVKSKF